MKKQLLITVLLSAFAFAAKAQCPDFTNLHSPNVQAFTGFNRTNNVNPFDTQGVVDGRHTVITQQGTDPNTGGALQLIPPGETSSIRLGNPIAGAQAEALVYTFTVDANNPVLLVNFAVVLEDPGHTSVHQPRFIIRITDENGELVEECAEYDVSARPDIPGFQSFQGSRWSPIRWRDWTSVGIDMSRLAGQQVQVQFITFDCQFSGHFGYAYFTARCVPNRLQVDGCTSTTFTLEAPDNFESYLWSNGETGRTATFNIADVNNSQIYATVTSATGCRFNLYAYVTTNPGAVQTGTFHDVICEGLPYNNHNFNLPPLPPGQHFFQNIIVNPNTCSDNQEINLHLTVVPRFNTIRAAICHGESFSGYGFNIVEPAVGIRRDTIRTGNANGCDTYNILELTVSMNLNMPNLIVGETQPCTNEAFVYTFAGAESLTRFEWILPDNARFHQSSRFSQTIQVIFSDNTPGVIQLIGENGCGTGTATLNVTPRQTYDIQLNEQVCQGENFNRHNFALGVQDDVGYFVFSKHLHSSLGCDSIVTLALQVLPNPTARIEPINILLCNPGDEVTLWALSGDMQYPGAPNPGVPDTIIRNQECYEAFYNMFKDTWSANSWNIFRSQFTTREDVTGEITITGFTGTTSFATYWIIPDSIDNKPVVGIASSAFNGLDIGSIILPPTLLFIVQGAFANIPNHPNTGASPFFFLPPSIEGISSTAFSNTNAEFFAFENSFAHQFAMDNGIDYNLFDVNCEAILNTPQTLSTTILPANETYVNIFDCEFSYLWNTGSTDGAITVRPTETTEFSVIITSQSGCWAEARKTVVVNTAAPQTIDVTICYGEVFSDYGLNATASGLYTVTVPGEDCDVTLNINLTVLPPVVTNIVDQVCAGSHFHRHGFDFVLIEPGLFLDTLRFRSHLGCDSIVTLAITVLENEHLFLQDEICQNSVYNRNGFNLGLQEITGEFTHSRTAISTNGCRQEITLQLTVNPTRENTISDELERGMAYTRYGFNFPRVMQDTTAVLHLQTPSGCDSTVVLNLRVNYVVIQNDTIEVTCNPLQMLIPLLNNAEHSCTEPVITIITPPSLAGNSASIAGSEMQINIASNFAGLARDSLQYSMECSGVIDTAWVHIFIDQRTFNLVENITIYEDELPLTFRDTTFLAGTTSSSHIFSRQTTLGCDSIVTLNLTVIPLIVIPCEPDTTRITAQICQGETYNFFGTTLTTTGTFEHTLVTNNGCDSTIVLNLVVNPTFNLAENITIYEDELPLTFRDTTFLAGTTSSSHVFNRQTTLGCDSIVTLNLTVIPLIVIPCEPDTTRISAQIFVGEYYSENGFWIATQHFPVVITDTLFLQNELLCDSLVILTLTVIDLPTITPECPEIIIPAFFTPNRDGWNDKWLIENIECYLFHEVNIYDRFGKLLGRWEGNFTGWDGTYLGRPMPTTDYWYLIRLYPNDRGRVGHFTLIRR